MTIRTPNDVLSFMDTIEYGWVDNKNNIHYEMEGFRKDYRTMSIKKTLDYHVGTCIEQSILIKYLLDEIGIPNEVYCCRIYEDENFNDLNAKERMHCFVLFYQDGKVRQLEHPDPQRRGIHDFESKEDAIAFLVKHYERMTTYDYKEKGVLVKYEDVKRPVTKFDSVKEGLTYKEFNLYINNLDVYKKNSKKRRW